MTTPSGHRRFEFFDGRFDAVGDFARVGVRLLLNRQDHSRLAIDRRVAAFRLRGHAHGGHVADQHGTITGVLDD